MREFPKEWSEAEVITINDNSTSLKVVEDRFPTSTYQVEGERESMDACVCEEERKDWVE